LCRRRNRHPRFPYRISLSLSFVFFFFFFFELDRIWIAVEDAPLCCSIRLSSRRDPGGGQYQPVIRISGRKQWTTDRRSARTITRWRKVSVVPSDAQTAWHQARDPMLGYRQILDMIGRQRAESRYCSGTLWTPTSLQEGGEVYLILYWPRHLTSMSSCTSVHIHTCR
jgi:hypothetical protein